MNTLINKIITVIILILVLWYLKTWLFPEKKDVQPVLNDSKTLLKDTKGKEDEKLDKNMDDGFIVHKLDSLQPDGQQADSNAGEPAEGTPELQYPPGGYEAGSGSESESNQAVPGEYPSIIEESGKDNCSLEKLRLLEIAYPDTDFVCETDDFGTE